jgi:hypothetical protein
MKRSAPPVHTNPFPLYCPMTPLFNCFNGFNWIVVLPLQAH